MSPIRLPAHIAKIQPYEPGKPIEDVERQLGLKNTIKLASNENPLGTSPLAREAGRKAMKGVFLYPENSALFLREKLAEDVNVPPFRVMNNQLLIELAMAGPKGLRELEALKGFTKRMSRKFGQGVLEAVERAHELGPIDKLPTVARKDGTDGLREEQVELFDRLKQWRKGVGVREKIESSYLLNRHVMLRIARSEPENLESLEEVDGMLPWQLELFGKAIVKVVTGFRADRAAGRLDTRRRGRRR